MIGLQYRTIGYVLMSFDSVSICYIDCYTYYLAVLTSDFLLAVCNVLTRYVLIFIGFIGTFSMGGWWSNRMLYQADRSRHHAVQHVKKCGL